MKKRILAFIITVLTAGCFLSVQADAPIVHSRKTTVFNQSFAGLSGAEELDKFDVTGTWHYIQDYIGQSGNYNCNGGVITKEAYDLSHNDYWKFDVKLLSHANAYIIYLGWDEANAKGYRLEWHNGNAGIVAGLRLYKAGEKEAVAVKEHTSLFGQVIPYEITFKNDKLSVVQNGVEMINYDAEQSEFNGVFGIKGASASMILLFDMSLEKGNSYTVNNWYYEEDFEGETVETLKEKGWTLNESKAEIRNDATYGDYIASGSGTTVFFNPDGEKLSGDFHIRTLTYVGYNEYDHYIALRGTNGYDYRIYPTYNVKNAADVKTAAIVKCPSGTKTPALTESHVLAQTEKSYAGIYYTTYEIDLNVKTTESGVSLEAIISKAGNNPVTLEVTDLSDIITQSSLMINYSSSDGYMLYEFSANSLTTETAEITYEKEILDKIFTSEDSYQTVKNTFSGTLKGAGNEYSFRTYPTYTDEGGLECSGMNICYNYADTTSDYTVEAKMYRMYNNSYVQFNISDDGKSYYMLETNYNNDTGKYIKIIKVEPSGKTDLAVIDKVGYGESGNGNWSDYKVNCDWLSDGSLKITADFTTGTYKTKTLTATDTSPLTGQNIRVNAGHTGKVKRIKLTAPVTETEDLSEFKVRFCDESGNVLTSVKNGAVYAYSGTVPLYGNTAVAVLYQNGMVTKLMPVDVKELSGKAKLFDISEEANSEIKLYIFENGKSLNKVCETAVLN